MAPAMLPDNFDAKNRPTPATCQRLFSLFFALSAPGTGLPGKTRENARFSRVLNKIDSQFGRILPLLPDCWKPGGNRQFERRRGGLDDCPRELYPVENSVLGRLRTAGGQGGRLSGVVAAATIHEARREFSIGPPAIVSLPPANPASQCRRRELLCAHARSKRSRFITLFHAAIKSCRNFFWESRDP
jgi:hypothetical protein